MSNTVHIVHCDVIRRGDKVLSGGRHAGTVVCPPLIETVISGREGKGMGRRGESANHLTPPLLKF